MLKKNKNDIILWCTITVLIFSSFFSFYYFSNYLMITRIFLLIFTFLISCFLFIKTYLGNFCLISVRESFKEIYLITWPTTKETLQTALIISGIVIFMGLILCLIDVIFFNIIKWVANFG